MSTINVCNDDYYNKVSWVGPGSERRKIHIISVNGSKLQPAMQRSPHEVMTTSQSTGALLQNVWDDTEQGYGRYAEVHLKDLG